MEVVDKKRLKLNKRLRFAAEIGSLKEIENLLEEGAVVNSPNKKGYTPLMLAAKNGHKDVCEVLIDKGANVNVITGKERGKTALTIAATRDYKEICKLLCDHGANVHVKNFDGWTILMSAAHKGLKEICELLITHGADVHDTNLDRYTALSCAAENGHKEICELLIAHDVAMHGKNFRKMTALMIAATAGYKEICELLLINTLLRGSSKVTIKEAKDRLFTTLLVFEREGWVNVPRDTKLVIISSLKDDLSTLVAHQYRGMDRFPQILQEAVANNIALFLLSQDGKSFLEEVQNKAKDTIKGVFEVVEILKIIPSKLGHLVDQKMISYLG